MRTKKVSTKRRPVNNRRLVEGWTTVHSMAVATDGRVFAGQHGGAGAAAWTPDGALQWQKSLVKTSSKSSHDDDTLHVQLVGDALLALCKYTKSLFVLDAAAGVIRSERAIPTSRRFRVSPDGTKLVLRVATQLEILSYPDLKPLAKFDHYCNHDSIAISADGRWLAVNGHEVHTYDLERMRHVATWTPEGLAWGAWTMEFTVDNELITGEEKGGVRIWDPTTGKRIATVDGAPGKSRKPAVHALATTATRLAVGREDGTVIVMDRKGKLLHSFDKHDTTKPGTAALTLGAVAFSDDGKRLWVSAGVKKQPAGLTFYDL
jgi:WD40 repeat protein